MICAYCVSLSFGGRRSEPDVCGHTSMPERRAEPREDLTGWERPAFACGCGRGCVSWPDHHARREAEAAAVDLEDVADEFDSRKDYDSDYGEVRL